jgi:hypothetical protein
MSHANDLMIFIAKTAQFTVGEVALKSVEQEGEIASGEINVIIEPGRTSTLICNVPDWRHDDNRSAGALFLDRLLYVSGFDMQGASAILHEYAEACDVIGDRIWLEIMCKWKTPLKHSFPKPPASQPADPELETLNKEAIDLITTAMDFNGNWWDQVKELFQDHGRSISENEVFRLWFQASDKIRKQRQSIH